MSETTDTQELDPEGKPVTTSTPEETEATEPVDAAAADNAAAADAGG